MITVSDRLSEESAKDYVLRQLTYNIVNVNLIPGAAVLYEKPSLTLHQGSL